MAKDYKWTQFKTVGFNEGRWEILLDNGRYLGGVQEIKINKRVGEFGKLELSVLIDEGLYQNQEKMINENETTNGETPCKQVEDS